LEPVSAEASERRRRWASVVEVSATRAAADRRIENVFIVMRGAGVLLVAVVGCLERGQSESERRRRQRQRPPDCRLHDDELIGTSIACQWVPPRATGTSE